MGLVCNNDHCFHEIFVRRVISGTTELEELCCKCFISKDKPDDHSARRLLNYINYSDDFPDNELADNIEKASKEFRKNFKIGDRYNDENSND